MDMSDALLDPEMGDFVTVKRQLEMISSKGRSEPTTETFEDVFANICSASQNQLDRLPEADRMGRNLSIITEFALQGPAEIAGTAYKADLVTWRGNDFVVKYLDPYPQFGPGFIQAVMGSTEIIDQAEA